MMWRGGLSAPVVPGTLQSGCNQHCLLLFGKAGVNCAGYSHSREGVDITLDVERWQVILPPIDLPGGFQPPPLGVADIAYNVFLDLMMVEAPTPGGRTLEEQWDALTRLESTIVVSLYMLRYVLY